MDDKANIALLRVLAVPAVKSVVEGAHGEKSYHHAGNWCDARE
ncbi:MULTISPECIES: hypothetical protein [Corynebacterium]|nr:MULTISPECIES: hypothetical protein [Corynebacterium]